MEPHHMFMLCFCAHLSCVLMAVGAGWLRKSEEYLSQIWEGWGRRGLKARLDYHPGVGVGVKKALTTVFERDSNLNILTPLEHYLLNTETFKKRAEMHSINISYSHKSAWVLQYNTVYSPSLNHLTVPYVFWVFNLPSTSHILPKIFLSNKDLPMWISLQKYLFLFV